MYYIGIDVSKKDLSVFNGKKDLKFINQKGLRPFKKYLKKKYKNFSDLVIIFEPTGIYSFNLKEFCAEKDIKVPKIDQQTKVLSSYLTSYEFAVKQRVAISNHLESLRDKKLTSLLKKELKRAQKLEDEIFNDIKEYIRQNQNLREDYERLLTISGVGEKMAIALLTLFKTYQGTNRAQITALVGLDSTKRESGSSVRGRAKISKNGKAIYRKVSYLPAICATVHNQKIKIFYQRLLANHKPKKLAIIASMRKILLIAHAMYRDKTEYVTV